MRLLLLLLATALLFAIARPAAAAPASNQSFVWDRIDVTVQLRPDASFRVSELARVVFSGGPFREGYREIPLARIERIDHVRVSDVSPEGTTPLRAVAPQQFVPSVPDTFATEVVGTNEWIEWSFSPTTSRARIFLIEYDVYGALRVYDDAEIPYQQISWAGVGRELTRDARVNHASLTFVLPRPVDPDRTVVAGPGSTAPRDHTKDGQTWRWQDFGLAGGESLEATLQFEPLVPASKPSWQDASDRQELGVMSPVLAAAAMRVTSSDAVRQIAGVMAILVTAHLAAFLFDPTLTAALWALLAVVAAFLQRPRDAFRLSLVTAALLLVFGVSLAVGQVAPPSRLLVRAGVTLDHPLLWNKATLALGALAAACFAIAWRLRGESASSWLALGGSALAIYLLSISIVDLFQARVDGTASVAELR